MRFTYYLSDKGALLSNYSQAGREQTASVLVKKEATVYSYFNVLLDPLVL